MTVDREAVQQGRSFAELRDSGLLWLINRVVFHPRGYALALHLTEAGEVSGWSLHGDGTEAYQYAAEVEENELLKAAEATLRAARTGG